MMLLKRNEWNEIAYTATENALEGSVFVMTLTGLQTGVAKTAQLNNESTNTDRYDLSRIAVPFTDDDWTASESPQVEGAKFYDLQDGEYEYEIKDLFGILLEFGSAIIIGGATHKTEYAPSIPKVAYEPGK